MSPAFRLTSLGKRETGLCSTVLVDDGLKIIKGTHSFHMGFSCRKAAASLAAAAAAAAAASAETAAAAAAVVSFSSLAAAAAAVACNSFSSCGSVYEFSKWKNKSGKTNLYLKKS